MEDANNHHPIACESCRNKKSKCDRELPICSQCISSRIACRYPPINKRGLPSGYLSYIEQRLLDTEVVVFELLSSIYKSQIPIQPIQLPETDRQALTDISQKQPKSAKIEEWKRLPLATDANRHDWWQTRCEMISLSTSSNSTGIAQDARTPQDTWLAASPLSAQYDETQSGLPNLSQQQSLMTSWPSSSVVMAPSAAGHIENDAHTTTLRSSIDGSSENNSGVAFIESDMLNTLSEERWRKYF